MPNPAAPSQEKPLPFAVHLVVGLVLLGGFSALAVLGLRSPAPPLVPFIVWTLMLVGAEAAALNLPVGGIITIAGIIDYAGIFCFGPLLVGWADVTGVLIYQGLWQRRPLSRVMFNAGLYALTTCSAGAVYILLGGEVGSGQFARSIPPLLALGATYFCINSAGVSAVLAIVEGRNIFDLWRDNFRWGLVQHWSMLPLGMLLAMLTQVGGLWMATLTVAPLALARRSFLAHLKARSDLKDFVRAISRVLDAVDPYTREHSLRVARYSVRVARGLRLPSQEVEMIEYAALMHDLGKITTEARTIVSKPGALTREEKKVLDQHPVVGAAIFEQVRSLRRAADYARAHHERLDGRGYPQGLSADAIPLGARILTVCDCYDAMTSDRPYIRARHPREAIAELIRNSGTQFDPDVVECFVRLYEEGTLAQPDGAREEAAPAPATAVPVSAPAPQTA